MVPNRMVPDSGDRAPKRFPAATTSLDVSGWTAKWTGGEVRRPESSSEGTSTAVCGKINWVVPPKTIIINMRGVNV